MVVYAIICTDKNGNVEAISSECYSTYENAVAFINTRSGNPVKESKYIFRADDGIVYMIKPLDVK